MTIRISKLRVGVAILAVAMLMPATALATHVFDDVDDGAFFADAVEWAFGHGITTGTTASEFSPLDDVTRGESVTFLKRYDDFVVQPALDTLDADLGAVKSRVDTVEGQVGALENAGMASVQETTSSDPIGITSTTAVLIEELTIGGTGTVDAVLNAHLQIENSGLTQGRFDVTLRLTDCDGAVLAQGGVRTGVTTSTFVNSTVSLAGFADDVAGGSTIALCADKVFGGAADGTAFGRGLTAIWS